MNSLSLYNMTRQLEDSRSNFFETLVYGSLLVSVIVSIVYAAVQPVIVPDHVAIKTTQTEYRA